VKAHRVNPTNFLTELKRRNVYRAAVAYGVVAWFLTQLTTQVFPFFEFPNSAVRFVVIAPGVGFPIAMILSPGSTNSLRSRLRAHTRRLLPFHALVVEALFTSTSR
jgi:hypothetical protein